DRTFVMAIDSTTLTNDKLYIDVTITASGTDVATERLSVELYNQSGSAVVGQLKRPWFSRHFVAEK
ncbi:hypothetical protein ACMSJT_004915, partial [Aeromonas hydrophila]|nr:hypothetical protein [Aeromonas hydrophila]